jgi:PAS domain S-box-containing protein
MAFENKKSAAATHAERAGTLRVLVTVAVVVLVIDCTLTLSLAWPAVSSDLLRTVLLHGSIAAAAAVPALYIFAVRPHVKWVRRVESLLADSRLIHEARAGELAQARARLEKQALILDQHVMIAETDLEGRITCANPQFCRISGYAQEELVGRPAAIVKSGHHPAAFWRDMYATLAAGDVWRAEVCNKAKDGTPYWVKTSVAPLKDFAGTTTGYVTVQADITRSISRELALKRAQAQLFETAAKAKAASVAKSNLMAKMCEEMRTHVQGILGALQVLRTTGLSREQAELLDLVSKSSEALHSRVTDIPDLAENETGTRETHSDLDAAALSPTAQSAEGSGLALGTLPPILEAQFAEVTRRLELALAAMWSRSLSDLRKAVRVIAGPASEAGTRPVSLASSRQGTSAGSGERDDFDRALAVAEAQFAPSFEFLDTETDAGRTREAA